MVRRVSGAVMTGALVLALLGLGVVPAVAQDEAADCWAEEPATDEGFPQWSEPPTMTIDPTEAGYVATLETNQGTIEVELYARDAPVTVNNFICLAGAGYYQETPFHRILQGFVIQGGDPTGTGSGGPGYTFQDELPDALDYERGTLAMANAGPDTNGSQFFIVLDDLSGQLPKDYTIFGRVSEGMDVVDEIAAMPVEPNEFGEPSRPTEEITLERVSMEETAPPPIRIDVGGTVVVGEEGATLRSAPFEDGVLVAELDAGTELTVLAEAEEVDGTAWRLVQDPETRNVGYVPADAVSGAE